MALDYSGQNLRGRSFRGKNLEGANFIGADIRGADFTKANLRGANFTGAEAGLQHYWEIILVIASFLLGVIPGFISVFASFWMAFHLTSNLTNQYNFNPVLLIVLVYIVFFATTIRYGFVTGVLAAAVVVVGVVTVAGVSAATVEAAGSGTRVGAVVVATVAPIVALIVAVAVAVTLIVAGAVAVVVSVLVVLAIALLAAGALVEVGAAGIGAVIGLKALAAALLAAVAVVGLGIYMAWRALACDEKYAFFRSIAIVIAAIGGTSFQKADLTDVNFHSCTLKNTDFRSAKLDHTYWFQTQKLDFARLGESYLSKKQVILLVITNDGQNKNFDRLDLCGINLCGANLTDASFVSTHLNQANLRSCDLSRAKLEQTQLDRADLTGATLTGAYIEDWGITSHTKLHGVQCEYVFMRSPTPDDPNPCRKPDNWDETFADGDFADFIKPIVDTLDLYHNSGVDPRAIAISFKQLAETHPDAELEIVAMEKRGLDKFLLRAKTAPEANKSQLSQEYFDTYNQLKALAEQELKALIAEKDSQIRRLETMVMTALERPNFYSNTQIEKVDNINPNQGGINQSVSGSTMHGGMQAAQGNNNTQNQGDTTVSDGRNINTGGGNYNERIQGNYVQGNYYAAGQQNLAQAAAEIQKLLEQLDKSYSTDTTAGKMAIAAQAIEYIDSNHPLAERVISALKSGGTQALAQLLNHPAASFVIGALDDWQKT